MRQTLLLITTLFLSLNSGSSAQTIGESVTIYSVYFAESSINLDWNVRRKEILELPESSIQQSETPLDVKSLWRIAFEVIDKAVPGNDIQLDSLQLMNLRFSPAVRGSADQPLGDRWFYVIRAKPKAYRNGKPLADEHLYTVVILANGRVVTPVVTERNDLKFKKTR